MGAACEAEGSPAPAAAAVDDGSGQAGPGEAAAGPVAAAAERLLLLVLLKVQALTRAAAAGIADVLALPSAAGTQPTWLQLLRLSVCSRECKGLGWRRRQRGWRWRPAAAPSETNGQRLSRRASPGLTCTFRPASDAARSSSAA